MVGQLEFGGWEERAEARGKIVGGRGVGDVVYPILWMSLAS